MSDMDQSQIDWEPLAELDDGTPECKMMVKRVIRLFLDTTRKEMDAMREDILNGRFGDLAECLHKLRGGSSTIGARAFSRQILAMEAELMSAVTESIPEMFENLEAEFNSQYSFFESSSYVIAFNLPIVFFP